MYTYGFVRTVNNIRS